MCVCVCVCTVSVVQSISHVQLFVTPWAVHGILQARILEWVAFPFSKVSSQLRDQTQVSCIAGGFLPASHKGSPKILEWVAYLFFSRSSWPRNWNRISCLAGGFFTTWDIREVHVYVCVYNTYIHTYRETYIYIYRERERVAIVHVSKSCLTLCGPMDCNLLGFPVLHGLWSLLKLMPTESVMASNHLFLWPPPSTPTLNLFQSQLFVSGG